MRHRKVKGHLGRPTEHRQALLRNMAISLILHERIHTTLPKAKALRRFVEPLVTYAREGGQHKRRLAFSQLQHEEAVHKLFQTLGERFRDRPGGYTRIVRDVARVGDGAEMAYIEFVDVVKELKEKPKKKEKRLIPKI